MAKRLVIFTALELETKAVAKALGGRYSSAERMIPLQSEHGPIELYTIGIRGVRMPKDLSAEDVCGLVMAGLAGALVPELTIGDLILDETREPLAGASRGKIHTADAMVSTVEAKAQLAIETAAVAVDMENRIAKEFAQKIGIPYWSIRAISDRADEAIDPRVIGLVDEMGRPRMGKVAMLLATSPTLFPSLKRLGDNSALAANRLGTFLAQCVKDGMFWNPSRS